VRKPPNPPNLSERRANQRSVRSREITSFFIEKVTYTVSQRRPAMEYRFFLTDARVVGHSAEAHPYTPARGLEPEYVPDDGCYLRLYGRADDGRSVMAELLVDGLRLRLILADDDAGTEDANAAVEELVQRANELRNSSADLDFTEVEVHVEHKPRFYGFEPGPTGIAPRVRAVACLTVPTPRLYAALRRAAEDALHDRPLPCGARPADLVRSKALGGRLLETLAPGAHFGTWVVVDGTELGDVDAVDVAVAATAVAPAPAAQNGSQPPPLILAAWDIECCSDQRTDDGGWAFTNPRRDGCAIRSISLVATTFGAEDANWRRWFLHTGPAALCAADVVAAEAAEAARGLVLTAAEAAPPVVVAYKNEAALLAAFAKLLRDELRPDILYSFNGDAFDAPYVELRVDHLTTISSALPHDQRTRGRAAMFAWGRSPLDSTRPLEVKIYTEDEESAYVEKVMRGAYAVRPKRFDSPGVAHHDVLTFAKGLRLEQTSLSAVSAHVLGGGAGKLDLPTETMLTTFACGDVRAWADVAVYNLRDAAVTMQIMIKLKQVQFTLQLAAVTNCTVPAICAGGQQKRLVAMVGREAHRRGLVFDAPTKLDFVRRPWLCGGGEKVKGASVLDVRAGWYRDPVVTCDYSSLYPSLLMSHNLCPSRVLLGEVEPELSPLVPAAVRAAVKSYEVEEIDDDVRWTYHVVQRGADGAQKGVLPVVASRLLAERKEAKTEMKAHAPGSVAYELFDAKQNALKVLCNSLYGMLNAILRGDLYCRPLGAIITKMGRKAIAIIQDDVQNVPGAEITAGDTDSVMFRLAGRTVEEAKVIGVEVAERVTQRLRADGAHAMTLAFEKVMFPSVFLAKKNYVYLSHKPGGGTPELVSMGSLSKKRGTAKFLKSAYATIERAYLLHRPEADIRSIQLAAVRHMLQTATVAPAEAFVETKMLSEEASYTATPPHVAAAKRFAKSNGGAWPTGQRVSILIAYSTSKEANKSKGERAYFLSQFLEEKKKVDLASYVQAVANRFEKLLCFTVPDCEKRFAGATRVLEQIYQPSLSFLSRPPSLVDPPAAELSNASAEEWLAWAGALKVGAGDRSGAAFFLEQPPGANAARKKAEKTPAHIGADKAAEKRKREAEAAVTPKMKKARIAQAAVAIARQPQRNAENRVPGKK
jgi:DNA polymerase elongation subunit (family B)